MTNRQSRFGEQLDIAADNIVHMAIFAGLAWGLFLQQEPGNGSWLPLALGAAAVLGNGFSFWLVNRAKSLRDRQAWVNPTQAARSRFIFKIMVSRDFSVVLLVFALVGKLGWFLWLAAIGLNVFWMIMAWVTRPSTIVRA